MSRPIETFGLSQRVERFVDKRIADAARYEHGEVLDSEGVYLLHELVAEAYAEGYEQGFLVGEGNHRAATLRTKDAKS